LSDELDTLRPLRRLRQLARDLRSGIERDDMALVAQAAGLLAPTISECQIACTSLSLSAGDAAEMAMETHQMLNECETRLMQAMAQVAAEIRRLQQGRKTVAVVQPRSPDASGLTLDTLR
jgi:hypothetical protein